VETEEVETEEVETEERIADEPPSEEDIFESINAVFEAPENTTNKTPITPSIHDFGTTTVPDAPSFAQTENELFKLLHGIAADVKEIKANISSLKSFRTEFKRIDFIEGVTTTISEVLKKRKPPSRNMEQSTPGPAVLPALSPAPFISPINNDEQAY